MGDVRNRGSKEAPNWYMRFIDTDGKRKERATRQPTKTLALQCLRETEARVARGILGVPERPTVDQVKERTVSFDKLAERFLVEYDRKKIKDIKAYRIHAQGAFRRVSPLIGKQQAAQITRERVEWTRDMLTSKGYTLSTVAGTLSYLSRLFTWAVEKKILTDSPMKDFEYPDAPPSEDHFTIEEVHALLHPSVMRPIVAFALLTGARKGEIFGLRWECVNFAARRIEIKRSYLGTPKSGKPRTVPMHRDLAPILEAWRQVCPHTPEGFVFPVSGRLTDPTWRPSPGMSRYAIGPMVQGWRMGNQNDMDGLPELLESLSCHVPDKAWHAMRHTFITQLAEASASPIAVEKIVGHGPSGNQITAGYTHVSQEFLARELGKLDIMPPPDMPPPAIKALLPEHFPPLPEGETLSTDQAAKRLGLTPCALIERARKDPNLMRCVQRSPKKNAHGERWRWRWPLPTPIGRQPGGRRRLTAAAMPLLTGHVGTTQAATAPRLMLPAPSDPDLLSYNAAADALGLKYKSLTELVRKYPELGSLATGEGRGNLRFRRADLLRWVESGVWQPKQPERMQVIRAALAPAQASP